MTEEGEFSSTYTFYLKESREGRKEREGGKFILNGSEKKESAYVIWRVGTSKGGAILTPGKL